MATYASSDDVANILGISNFPTSGAPVTTGVVNKWIDRYEDFVNSRTMDSWKKLTVTNELQDYIGVAYRRGLGVAIFLNQTDLFAFDSSEGDKIEVWDGNSWVDWITSGSHTEGRENDYYVDLKRGVLWLKNGYSMIPQGVRITYRHGNKDVPGDIADAVTLLVAARIMGMDGTHALLQEAGADVPPSEEISSWRKEAMETIRNYRGFRALGPISQ